MNGNARIVIDIHESDSGIFEEIKARGYEATVKSLPIGDITINHNHRNVAIEIKRKSDYSNSLKDGRLKEQICKMDSFDFSMLIVEAWTPYFSGEPDIDKIAESVRKHEMSIRTLNRRLPTYETKDQDATLNLIEEIIRDMVNGKLYYMKRPIIIEKELSDSLKILCSCRHVSRVRGERLLEVYGTPEGAFNALDVWHELGIGLTLERSERIKRAFQKDSIKEMVIKLEDCNKCEGSGGLCCHEFRAISDDCPEGLGDGECDVCSYTIPCPDCKGTGIATNSNIGKVK